MIVLTRRMRCFALVLTAAFVVAVVWRKIAMRPTVVARLADGSELRLVEFGYGPSVALGPPPSFRDRVQDFFLSRPKRKQDINNYSQSVAMLVFTLHDPKTGGVSTPAMTDFEVFDTNSGIKWPASGMSLEQQWNEPREVVVLESYPRRAAQFRVRCKIRDELVEMIIPNRHRITAAPQWKADPVPQTRRVGEREYTLKGIRIAPMPAYLVPHQKTPGPHFITMEDLEIRDHGIIKQGYTITPIFEDETGNKNSSFLPASEPVWHLRLTISPHNLWKYDPSDIWSLGTVLLPKPGEYQVLPVPPEAAEHGVVQIALLGIGNYVWEDGKFTIAKVGQIASGARQPIAGHYFVDCSAKAPVLTIIRTGDKAPEPISLEARVNDHDSLLDLNRISGGGGRGIGADAVSVSYFGSYTTDLSKFTDPVEVQLLNRRDDTIEFAFPAPTSAAASQR